MDKDKQIKQIIFGQPVRNKVDRGLEIAYRAVATTLGSRGRNVAYELNWGAPNVIHDGVTVAREIVLKDPYENMAAQLVLTAAQNTNNQAGDGTTTATILTYAIAHEALQVVSAGTNPMIIRKGIELAVKAVVEELKRMAKEVKSPEEMEQVATISAADPEMGKLIATAVQKVGKDGVVSVQEGQSSDIEVEYKEGMEFQQGMLNYYMITSQERVEGVLDSDPRKEDDEPYIVIVNEKLTNEKLVTLLEKIYDKDQHAKVLVVADDYEVDAVNTIILSIARARKRIIAVKAPDFGEHRTNILNDMAVLTGGECLGGTTGIAIEQATLESIGRAEKVISTREQTVIIGGKGEREKIEARIKGIEKLMNDAKTEFQRDKLEGRKSKLVGGVAVISVGAPSEAEMREKKERVYDAVNATKAAISEGIVPGGGVALVQASKVIDRINFEGREKIGADIVKAALRYPMRKLVENAGADKPDYIVGKVLESEELTLGYNVDSEDFEDMIKSGIIDPLKVTRSALQNAASVATMLITTDCMIVFEREKQKEIRNDDEGIGKFLD